MRPCTYQFGDFRLDPSAHELYRGAELVTLPPRAFDCIVYLIEHRDRAVGRDELVAAVWGKTDVTDAQLYGVVRNARRAIGERGDEPGTIRTIPRVGFRWVREIRVDEGVAVSKLQQAEAHASVIPGAASHRRSGRKRILAAILLGVCVALAVVGGHIWKNHAHALLTGAEIGPGASPSPTDDVIAVLPLDVGNDVRSEDAWLRLGLMDFIANRLREGGLRVMPSDNVVAVARDEKTPGSAAGRIRRASNACCIVTPAAVHTDAGWVVHLEWRKDDDAPPQEIEARAKDAIGAARGAAEQLLEMLGRSTRERAQATTETPAAEWYQRAEAAELHDDFDSARRVLESAPEPIRSSRETRMRLASIDLNAGRFDEARRQFTELLPDLSPETEPLTRARTEVGIAAAAIRQGDADAAILHCTPAIALLSTLREPMYLARAYNVQAAAYFTKGQFDQAAANFSKARVAFELASDALELAHVELNEGAMMASLGRPAEGLPLLQHAAQTLQRFGAVEAQSVAVDNQISANLDLLQSSEALAVATRAGTQFDALHNNHWRLAFKYQHARALIANGRLTEGRLLLDEIVRDNSPNEATRIAAARGILAQLELDAGRPETAFALAMQAVNVLTAPDSTSDRRTAWFTAVRALRRAGKSAESVAEGARFAQWADASGDHAAVLLAHVADAEQAWSSGRREAASKTYENVIDAVSTSGSLTTVVYADSSYANALIDAGELERASAIAGQIARYADRDFSSALLQVRLYHALGQDGAWHTALDRARALAGERPIPPSIATPP